MSRLTDILKPYRTIAVVGMCKNAGKTTALNHIIGGYYNDGVLGITSIGYDGEETDEITNLKKPRIEMYPGMLAATCENCLKNAEAEYKIIADTDINTVLGKIYIIEITNKGILEISGPSMVSQIERLSMQMQDLGCEKVIVDGSAGRKSFASKLECTILSVGAAQSNDMAKVIRQAVYQTEMFNLKKCSMDYAVSFDEAEPYVQLRLEKDIHFVFRGALVDNDLNEIIKRHKGYNKTVIVNDAASIFISPRMYKKFIHREGEICVRSRTNLAALTINPMTPYGRWFDKDKFISEIKEQIKLPVFNVLDEKV